MRTETIAVYTFNGLDEKAKDRARNWYSEGLEYPRYREAEESIKAFCSAFHVHVLDYEYGPFNSHNYIKTDAEPAHFRGLKLRDVDREAMRTGYCLDNTLQYAFYDAFKQTGDAFSAFKCALDAAISDIVADVEYYHSTEAIDEMLEVNGYEFTADGRVF